MPLLLCAWRPSARARSASPVRQRNKRPPQHRRERPPSNASNSRAIEESAARRFERAFFPAPAIAVNEDALRRDFHALWNTQYFEDIRLEIEDSADKPNQKIVIFYVTERPIIRRIEYKGNKSVSESDILDRFKDRKVGLSIESQFDPTRIKKAEVVSEGVAGRAWPPVRHRQAHLRTTPRHERRKAHVQHR